MKAKEIKIGIFTITVLVCAFFGFNYLKSNNVFGNDYPLTASLEKTNGLDVGSVVLLKGYKIGSVQGLRYDMQTHRVLVDLNMNGNYPLPRNTTFKVGSPSMLSGPAVMVNLGNDTANIYSTGDTILVANDNPLMEMLTQNLEQIMAKVDTTLSRVNTALSDENVESISSVINNVKNATSSLQHMLASNQSNIREVIANLATLSGEINEMMPQLKTGVSDLSQTMAEVKKSAPQLMQNASKSIESLSAILQKVEQGEGTVGKAVTDQQLYDNLTQTLADLSLLVTDLKENPGRYINVTVFGRKQK